MNYRLINTALLTLLTLGVCSVRASDDDPVAKVIRDLESGAIKLPVHDQRGYLDGLLDALNISKTSQVVAFSKTSLQSNIISPDRPRAMYFNDDVYVGFVPNGIIEIASVDPDEGLVFYTIDNSPAARLDAQAREPGEIIKAETEDCIDCHGQTSDNRVSRLLVRSVFADDDGFPMLPFGSFSTTHESPLSERWGGWYLSGSTGSQTTMANTRYKRGDPNNPQPLDDTKPRVDDLSALFDTTPYLTNHSDVVALMVFEHQIEMHNRINRARHGVLRALHDEEVTHGIYKDSTPGLYSESTLRRVRSSCEPLVEYMLMSGEVRLTSPIVGASGFNEHFSQLGPRDGKGRSLRDLDLKTRLFKYPCSFLVYTDSFKSLPKLARDYVRMRLEDILAGKDSSEAFAHLTADDRAAIGEILAETAPMLVSKR